MSASTIATLSNSIVWGNRSRNLRRQDAQLYEHGRDRLTIEHCCVQHLDGSLGGQGNIAGDPRLPRPPAGRPADGDGYDLRLAPWSACIDSGSNALVGQDRADLDRDGDTRELLPVDLAGNSRFADGTPRAPGRGYGAVVDIGAYEALGPGPRAPRRR